MGSYIDRLEYATGDETVRETIERVWDACEKDAKREYWQRLALDPCVTVRSRFESRVPSILKFGRDVLTAAIVATIAAFVSSWLLK